MKRLRIYLDTSVVNFLFADDAPDFRKVTEEFFAVYAARYDLFVSDVVIAEILRDPDPTHREKLLDVLATHPVTMLPGERLDEVRLIAGRYLDAGIVPERKAEDALHGAYATVFENGLPAVVEFQASGQCAPRSTLPRRQRNAGLSLSAAIAVAA